MDASKQSVAISTEVRAILDLGDLTQDPPQLSINVENYTARKDQAHRSTDNMTGAAVIYYRLFNAVPCMKA